MLCIPTRNPNKWYVPIVETVHVVMAPILSSQPLSIRCNAALFQNNGNCNIVLDNGFTLVPGQAYMFGNYSELNTIILETTVRFDLTTVPVGEDADPRLEMVEIQTKLTGSGYYIDQPVLNPM